MTVEISDVKHLERVIKSIKGVQGCWASREPPCVARMQAADR